MKNLKQVILENLKKPYRVRVKSNGYQQVTMSPEEAQRHRSPDILKDRKPQVGDHVRRPYDWNTTSVITDVRELPQPDKWGNTHVLTHRALGRVWKKGSIAQGGTGYKPTSRATPAKYVAVGLHPIHGWHSNPKRWIAGEKSQMWSYTEKPHGREHFVVKPKEASFVDFYDKK